MKNRIKKTLIILLALLIIIQLFRPEKNKSDKVQVNAIETKYKISAAVKDLLRASCYDCHSNNTVYPWYAEIQPVAWWLNDHVQDGKRGLNFSEFTTYSIRRQYGELADITEHIKNDEMPLKSYLLIHRYATLDNEQKSVIFEWVDDVRKEIKSNYPADSLVKKRY